jgi:hypothetical protein
MIGDKQSAGRPSWVTIFAISAMIISVSAISLSAKSAQTGDPVSKAIIGISFFITGS